MGRRFKNVVLYFLNVSRITSSLYAFSAAQKAKRINEGKNVGIELLRSYTNWPF